MLTSKDKVCSKCGTLKPIEAFNKNKSTADGLQYYCQVRQIAFGAMKHLK